MIQDYNGDKVTAKHLAQSFLHSQIQNSIEFCFEHLASCGMLHNMSEKEQAEVYQQILKQSARVNKTLGYEVKND